MGLHRLPSGREVYLYQVKVVGTYSGFHEGSPATISQLVRTGLQERATRELPPARPLTVVLPPPGELPEWLCVAELRSRRGVHRTNSDYHSRLYACCFVADTAQSIDAIIEAILPQLDWERLAEDYNVMDF